MGQAPVWCQGGRSSPSTLSRHLIHRAFQTEEESFWFFLANMLPSSMSTSSTCCYICCRCPLLPLQGSHLVGFLGLRRCGSICLEISKPRGLTSPRVVLEALGEMFSAVPSLGTACSERVAWSLLGARGAWLQHGLYPCSLGSSGASSLGSAILLACQKLQGGSVPPLPAAGPALGRVTHCPIVWCLRCTSCRSL